MNTSHKSRFLKTRFAREHADLVGKESFQYSVDIALLEYVSQQITNKDQYLDACASNRIAGARQFIDVLMNLSEAKPQTKLTTKSNLQHVV